MKTRHAWPLRSERVWREFRFRFDFALCAALHKSAVCAGGFGGRRDGSPSVAGHAPVEGGAHGVHRFVGTLTTLVLSDAAPAPAFSSAPSPLRFLSAARVHTAVRVPAGALCALWVGGCKEVEAPGRVWLLPPHDTVARLPTGENTDEDCKNSCEVVFCPCHGFAGAWRHKNALCLWVWKPLGELTTAQRLPPCRQLPARV